MSMPNDHQYSLSGIFLLRFLVIKIILNNAINTGEDI